MKCTILHENSRRMRVHMAQSLMTLEQADILEAYLNSIETVTEAKVNERTCNVVICFRGERTTIIAALQCFRYDNPAIEIEEHTGRRLSHDFEDKIVMHILKRTVTRLFLPLPLRSVITAVRSINFILPGLKCLASGKLEVPVLDAATLILSMLRNDFDTAGDLMFLLGLSEILEDWTHRKSVDDLARSMSLHVDQVWKTEEDKPDILVPVVQIHTGDRIRLCSSNVIPLDGIVVSGSAAVNQSSLTGESLPVNKEEGGAVYAGTIVEEGEIVVCVTSCEGEGRYDRIVRMIEESEKLKSVSEDQAAALADRLVPWSFALTAGVFALTRNSEKAMAVMMVDFSCALKLSIPIAVLSAMRQASNAGISVKGGRFLEAAAQADTVVFDKTGTLTASLPQVADVVAFGGRDPDECLRLAACLEEHYPHSMANAVVRQAQQLGLVHAERHTKVEYVVAHGIVSSVDGIRVSIGSRHFIFEDEGCRIPDGEQERFDSINNAYSHLFLAVGEELAAVICVEDPIRPEARSTISGLHECGINRIVMMTGDSRRTAAAVAASTGVDEYHAEVLPEDKAAFIRKEKQAGRKIMMVGDGINDTPALSEADVAIAVSSGAAIAREIADISIPAGSIDQLVWLRRLSETSQKRIQNNYHMIIGINSTLIILGILGILTPSTTAYLHNFSTLALSTVSLRDLKVKPYGHSGSCV